MKNNSVLYLFWISIIVAGCSSNKQAKDGLPVIDIRKSYPEKEIILTDIADVTYLHLNTDNDEYLYKGTIQNVTDNTIVVYDNSSGSILFFSKDGSPKSRFNRSGQGPEEYLTVSRIMYDEEKDDVYVGGDERLNAILIYSSKGEYKRKIALPQDIHIPSMISFDDQSFYVHTLARVVNTQNVFQSGGETDLIPSSYYTTFYQIAKADGAVLDYLELPNNETELMIVYYDKEIMLRPVPTRMVKGADGIFLCNPENDTVFLYDKDKSLTPVFYKTPPMRETKPKTYLNNCCDIGGYTFFEVITLDLDLSIRKPKFPISYYVLDKKTNEIFRQKIVLPDYKNKEFTITPNNIHKDNVTNGAFFELDLVELKEAYNENRLSGKLKDLVVTLNEFEDNNVFMFVYFK